MARITSLKVGDINVGQIVDMHLNGSQGHNCQFSDGKSNFMLKGRPVNGVPLMRKTLYVLTKKSTPDKKIQDNAFDGKFRDAVICCLPDGGSFYSRDLKWSRTSEVQGKIFKWTIEKEK